MATQRITSRKKIHWSNRFQKKEPGIEGTIIQALLWVILALLTVLIFTSQEGVNFNFWSSCWIGESFLCLISNYFYNN